MLRGVAALAVACAVAAAPPAGAAELTPLGPATLVNTYSGVSTLEGRPPEVLVAWKVVVGAGGRAGTVRARVSHAGTTAVGDPVQLPAAPGTYTFPAPHIRWDYRGGRLGIDQTTGGHAIVDRQGCRPQLGRFSDPCEIYSVRTFVGDPPPGAGGTPTDTELGAQLTITGLFEHDVDQDLRGDVTEDRTDLRLSAAPTRDADGRLRIKVTVFNAGPLTADRPVLQPAYPSGRWEGGCLPTTVFTFARPAQCSLAPLAAGDTRTLTLVADAPDAATATISLSSEGPDLVAADNAAVFALAAAPAFDLAAAKQQRLSRGVTVRLRGVRAGRARVTVAFTLRGHTVKLARTVALAPYAARTVTLQPTGAKLRSLRRAARRGPLRAEITARSVDGTSPVTVRTTVR